MTGPAGRVLIFLLLLPAGEAAAQEAPDWSELGPFFAGRCTLCHSGDGAPLGLRLDSYEGALAGSWNGPVLIPGDVAGSELIRRVRGESRPAMPLVGDPLTEEIVRIEAWILAGLPEGDGPAEVAEPGPEAQAEPPAEAPAADEPTKSPASEAEPEPEPTSPEEEQVAADDPAAPVVPPPPSEPVTFADVERIFLQRCAVCHSDAREGGPPEGLRLVSWEAILQGGERVVVIPGRPEASEIVRRIEGTAEPRMPFDGPPWLEPEQIELIRRWIEDGARDEEGEPAPMPVGGEVRYRGILTGPEEIDGIPFRLGPGTRIDDRPEVGEEAELRGVVAPDGGIEATRFRDR